MTHASDKWCRNKTSLIQHAFFNGKLHTHTHPSLNTNMHTKVLALKSGKTSLVSGTNLLLVMQKQSVVQPASFVALDLTFSHLPNGSLTAHAFDGKLSFRANSLAVMSLTNASGPLSTVDLLLSPATR